MTQENYIKIRPEQFKDSIDKWLFSEFGIIGGCCSAQESLKYYIARMVAEKLNDVFIEKACVWLEKNIAEATGMDSYAITESFKKAMEE